VDIYVQEWAMVSGLIVTVETSGGVIIGSTSVPVGYDNTSSGAPYKLTINTSSIPALASAGTYRVYFSAGTGTPRYSTTGYNYTEGTNSIILTGGTRYFTNIQFSAGSSCARLPVVAKIGGCSSLPVTFGNVTAEDKGSYTLLTWSTFFEENNDQFEVERSTDGHTFEAIGHVLGSGSSHSLLAYSYADHGTVNNKVYYRIAQVDIDGTRSYSSVVILERDTHTIYAAPNPFGENTSVMLKGLTGTVTIKLFSVAGEEVFSIEANASDVLKIGENLPSGVYVLKVISETGARSIRIIKL
jgi:hypothetical protein